MRALAAAAPLRRRRLPRPRWVASYGVGFDSTPIATGRHYGVNLNGAPSRARGPGRRRPPRSGIAAAGAGVFFFDFAAGVRALAAAAPLRRRRLLRPRWVASYRVGFDSTPIATGRHYRRTSIARSRARGPGRRRPPRSGIAAAGAGVFFFDFAAGVRALAAAAPLRRRRLPRPRWVASYGVRLLIPPRSQLDGTTALTSMAHASRARGPGRRRPPRSGIAAAGAGVFFFDFAAGVRALAAAAPLRRRRLLRPRWVASYRVGFEFHPDRNWTALSHARAREGRGGADRRALGRWQLPPRCGGAGCRGRVGSRATGFGFDSTPIATGRHYGVNLNGAPSRARGPGRRRPPRSGIAAAGAGVFFFDFAAGVRALAAAAPLRRRRLLRPRWVASYRVGLDSTPIATGRHYRTLARARAGAAQTAALWDGLRRRFLFYFCGGGRWQLPPRCGGAGCRGRVGSRATGSALIPPRSQLDGTTALTSMAHPRAACIPP